MIAVDWKKGAQSPYQQAASNTRVVGAEVAVFIQNFESATSLSRSKIHIIGHGLGAHIAGYAGERLKGLARITGRQWQGPKLRYIICQING